MGPIKNSSVAKRGGLQPPFLFGLSTNMQNKENTTFFSTSETVFCTGLD